MNVDVPAVVGVPEIVPVLALRVNPAGRLPELTDHVMPDTLAANVAV